jgi:hypothetical protein
MEDVLKRAANPWRVPKLQKVFEQLGALAQRQKVKTARAQTAQSAPVDGDRLAQMARDEELVRQVLALFNIDYNGFIAMDGKSCYCQAMDANPQLAQQVALADWPILEALKVALEYQPYAEFTSRYGRTPEEIRQNMQAELAAQNAPAVAMEEGPREPAMNNIGPVFSRYAGSAATQAPTRKKDDLASLFGR